MIKYVSNLLNSVIQISYKSTQTTQFPYNTELDIVLTIQVRSEICKLNSSGLLVQQKATYFYPILNYYRFYWKISQQKYYLGSFTAAPNEYY